MKRLLFAAALVLSTWSVPGFAQLPQTRFYVGGNGIWWADTAYPSDFEAGANAAASLSPHISAVASGWYGFAHSYVRAAGGFRITASDPANENFSIGIGAQYHVSSEPAIHPEELAFDTSIGYRPWPIEQPKLTLVAQGFYGMESKSASVLAGARWTLGR